MQTNVHYTLLVHQVRLSTLATPPMRRHSGLRHCQETTSSNTPTALAMEITSAIGMDNTNIMNWEIKLTTSVLVPQNAMELKHAHSGHSVQVAQHAQVTMQTNVHYTLLVHQVRLSTLATPPMRRHYGLRNCQETTSSNTPTGLAMEITSVPIREIFWKERLPSVLVPQNAMELKHARSGHSAHLAQHAQINIMQVDAHYTLLVHQVRLSSLVTPPMRRP